MSKRLARGWAGGLAVIVMWAAAAAPALAAFHLWKIKEAFTNADGTVQFIELFVSSSGENFLNGHRVITDNGTFTFPLPNPSGSTLNKHLLLATAGFGSLPGGVTPNYTIPANFLSFPSGFITFDGGPTTVTYNNLPSDGVMSLTWNPLGTNTRSVTVNSPTNFAGATGSVNLTPTMVPGDVNGDAVTNALDIDAISDAIFLGETDDVFDLNGDMVVNEADRFELVQNILGTRLGDLNLDRRVTIGDLSGIATNFGRTFTPPGAGAGAGGVLTNWERGDMNGDYVVNITDLSLLATNFGFDGTAGATGAAVPEPATASLLLLGAAGLFRRR